MSILIFIVILAVLVLSHEFGHFIVAKMCGMRVDEFGFGFPPKIFSLKFGETEYSINWIPFGGFVKILGENKNEGAIDSLSVEEQDRAFYSKPKYLQAAVIVAGIIFNIVLAWFLFSAGFMSGLPVPVGTDISGREIGDARLFVTSVIPNSPADMAGFLSGDNIVYLQSGADALENVDPVEVSSFISSHGEREVLVGVKRGDSSEIIWRKAKPIPNATSERPIIGITMDMVGIVKLGLLEAFREGFFLTLKMTKMTAYGIWSFIAGLWSGGSSFSAISGPVGIVGIVGDAYGLGFIFLLGLTAMISLNLAVLNLIPFPALDGGRLLFIILEAIMGRDLNQKIVNGINVFGFIILLFLMVAISLSDILKLF